MLPNIFSNQSFARIRKTIYKVGEEHEELHENATNRQIRIAIQGGQGCESDIYYHKA